MIYHIQTFCTYGYWPEDLSLYSKRPIIVACDMCKETRNTIKYRADKLCISCALVKRWSKPEEQEKQSVAQKKRYKDPEERKKSADATKKAHKDDPMIVDRIREGIKNSDKYKAVMDKQRGGNDIVKHHYIYDHNDLSLYTMEMTRSRHTWLHNTMRRAEIEIPHINIKEE